MPQVSSSSIASSNQTSTRVWEKFDVTSTIKSMVSGSQSNHGFLIRFPSYSRGVSMRSAQSDDERYRPKLVITIRDDNAPTVTLTSPTGGEKFKVGTEQFITWNAQDTKGIACRAIYLSTDNGSQYELIDSAKGNTGSYKWTVANKVSDECKVKVYVYDEASNRGTAVSDKFSIVPAVGIITSNQFNLPSAKEYQVSVMNLQGRELSSFTIKNLDQLTGIQAILPAGMLLMKVSTPTQSVVRKLNLVR